MNISNTRARVMGWLSPSLLLTGMIVPTGCGSKVDVAELDREQGRVDTAKQSETGASGDDTSGPSSTQLADGLHDEAAASEQQPAAGPLGPQPSSSPASENELDADCYDLETIGHFSPGEPGGITVGPVPARGCSFHAGGDQDTCFGMWTCCDDVFTVTFGLSNLGDELWTDMLWESSPRLGVPGIGRSTGSLYVGQTCPLLDANAGNIAAEGFGYSPAWYEAVAEVVQTNTPVNTPQVLDPLPLGCTFALDVTSASECHGTIVCPEHEYVAGYDAAGELICERDGVAVTPHSQPDHVDCSLSPAGVLPANECFGPGWSLYFQLAAAPTYE